MDKDDAIEYLERKEMIRKMPEEEKFTEEEKKFYTIEEKEEIERVMKEGKIYGDPLVELKK